MTYFYRTRGDGPLAPPPRSATEPDDFPRLGFSLAKVGLLQVYLLIPTHAYYTVNGHISKRGSQVNNHSICRNETFYSNCPNTEMQMLDV